MYRELLHEGSIIGSSECWSDSDFHFCYMMIQEEGKSEKCVDNSGEFNTEKCQAKGQKEKQNCRF